MKQPKHLIKGTVVAASALAVLATSGTALAQFKPRKPVDFVIMAGTGGGADQMARLMQSIIQKNDFTNQPVIPINKGGGSGAEALVHLNTKRGDAHTLMFLLNSYYTTPLRTNIGVDIADFTPIARMAIDTFLLWVSADSDIQDYEQWVQAVKDADGAWKMGGTGRGQEDSLVTALLEQEFGIKMTYIPFKGGGTVAKNLIGGHIDSTVNNPSEQRAFYEADRSRPLAAFTSEPIEGFDAPTFKSLGHPDLEYYMTRGVVAPPDMPEDAQEYYIDVFQKVNDSEEWTTYTEREGLNRAFITGDEFQDFLIKQRDAHEKLLKGMGEI